MAVAPDSLLQNRLTICAMLNPGFIRHGGAWESVFLLSYAALKNNESFYLDCPATVIFDPGTFAIGRAPAAVASARGLL